MKNMNSNHFYVSFLLSRTVVSSVYTTIAGVDPGFQVGGVGALKKIAPSGGRRDNFWGISCEKSPFYANKSYLFQF